MTGDDPLGLAATEVRADGETLADDDTAPASSSAPSDHPVALAPPTNRYQLGKEIARGGMGRVLEAQDRVLGREVAIKEALSRDEALLRRFVRETQITARLEHPSIVPVYDAGQLASGAPFYAMRRISGRPLEQLILDEEALGARLALLPHVLAVAQAVAHAHARGVIHRDLKPNNILIGQLGETIVIDWGLAKVVGEPEDAPAHGDGAPDPHVTHAGMVVGTPGYMAPEQIQGEPVDTRTDVYSLGATLYFLLTRRPPHRGKTADTVLDAAMKVAPTPIRELAPGTPPELIAIVDKALARDPILRYPDARGFAEDLGRFLSGQLVAAHHYSSWERVLRFARRHRLVLGVIALALAALAVIGGYSVSRVIDARDHAERSLAHATERNTQLFIEHLRTLVASNPTLAVALAKPLADAHWRDVRAIGMAARTTGIARGLPASPTTLDLALLPGDRQVVSSGDDGVVRVHDLDGQATRTLTTFAAPMRFTLAPDGTYLLAWGDSQLVTVELATGRQRTLEIGARVDEACIVDGDAWVRMGGRAARLAPGATALAPVEIAQPIRVLSCGVHSAALLAPDGVWLAHKDTPPTRVATREPVRVAWRDDDTLLAVIERGQDSAPRTVAVVDVTTREVRTRHPVAQARAIAWQQEDLLVGAWSRLVRIKADGSSSEVWVGEGAIDDVQIARGDLLLVHAEYGAYSVLHPRVRSVLPSTSRVDRFITSARTGLAIGASDGVLLVWTLDDMMPTELDLPSLANYELLPGNQLLLQTHDGSVRWLDRTTGSQTLMHGPTNLTALATSADGRRVVLRSHAMQATVYTRGDPAPIELPDPVDHVRFVSASQLVAVTPRGEIALHDLSSAQRRVLATGAPVARNVEPDASIDDGGWFSVLRSDRSIWRYHVATDQITELPASPSPRVCALTSTGDVYIGEGTTLRVWRRDGTLQELITLPKPVLGVAELDGDDHLVLGTSDIGAVVVDLRTLEIRDRFPPGSAMLDWRMHRGFMTWYDSGGRVHVSDLATPLTWRLTTPSEHYLWKTRIDSEGTLYALAAGRLLTWNVAVPSSAAETSTFFARMTNAHAALDTQRLRWD